MGYIPSITLLLISNAFKSEYLNSPILTRCKLFYFLYKLWHPMLYQNFMKYYLSL